MAVPKSRRHPDFLGTSAKGCGSMFNRIFSRLQRKVPNLNRLHRKSNQESQQPDYVVCESLSASNPPPPPHKWWQA
eukprot:6551958-Pyramimonas_sp.AAC.1